MCYVPGGVAPGCQVIVAARAPVPPEASGSIINAIHSSRDPAKIALQTHRVPEICEPQKPSPTVGVGDMID
jgi:hypothetical protein